MEECLFFDCHTLREEGEYFCDFHKKVIAESEYLVICSKCGRIIDAKKAKKREIKEERCKMCEEIFGKEKINGNQDQS